MERNLKIDQIQEVSKVKEELTRACRQSMQRSVELAEERQNEEIERRRRSLDAYNSFAKYCHGTTSQEYADFIWSFVMEGGRIGKILNSRLQEHSPKIMTLKKAVPTPILTPLKKPISFWILIPEGVGIKIPRGTGDMNLLLLEGSRVRCESGLFPEETPPLFRDVMDIIYKRARDTMNGTING